MAINMNIINFEDVKRQIEMAKRQNVLKLHPYKVWLGKDGKWRTYLPDETKGRKLVKKNAREDIEYAIFRYYEPDETEKVEKISKTFDEVYWHWRSVQDVMVVDNTTIKYDSDYKRFFKNTEFAGRMIDTITEEDVKVFICNTVKTKEICKKACKTLFGYMKNTFNSGRINGYIQRNPMEFLEAKDFYKFCTDKEQSPEKRVISQADMDRLFQRFFEDYREQPHYIPTYAVHFAALTGMRVSEISALTWENVKETYILINQSEKYNRKTQKYSIGKTKNKKARVFPMTAEIRMLLDAVKKAEMQAGYLCEWVFADEDGRLHSPVISSCSKNKCKQLGIEEKGIHAYRRTVNSKMRCNGVSATVAASLLGHTTEVNEQYYTYDVTSIEEKAKLVANLYG